MVHHGHGHYGCLILNQRRSLRLAVRLKMKQQMRSQNTRHCQNSFKFVLLVPLGPFETLGPMDNSGLNFFIWSGHNLTPIWRLSRNNSCLFQQLSITTQHFRASAFCGNSYLHVYAWIWGGVTVVYAHGKLFYHLRDNSLSSFEKRNNKALYWNVIWSTTIK